MPSELIVLSHLRWDWVWQRPQQLVSRLSSAPGRRTWFVEEPRTTREPQVSRAEMAFEQLPELVGPPGQERIVWIYTPLALEAALALEPTTLVYDVMDDLAAFKGAAPELVVRQRQALREADVVFAGGRSLHNSVIRQGRADALLFPSGVAPEHYHPARRKPRPQRTRPVAGYVGVIDERLDLNLIRDTAALLPDWEIRIVGPVAKIDPQDLPQAPNITYPGHKTYAELPAVMAGLDVALMPFALNEATRSISPTKTLEYLAAGLPVVSTRVPDVVADYPGVVHLADDGAEFAAACLAVIQHDLASRDGRARPLQARQEWDVIAASMARLLDDPA